MQTETLGSLLAQFIKLAQQIEQEKEEAE